MVCTATTDWVETLFWIAWFTPAWQAQHVPRSCWATATVTSLSALAGSKSDQAIVGDGGWAEMSAAGFDGLRWHDVSCGKVRGGDWRVGATWSDYVFLRQGVESSALLSLSASRLRNANVVSFQVKAGYMERSTCLLVWVPRSSTHTATWLTTRCVCGLACGPPLPRTCGLLWWSSRLTSRRQTPAVSGMVRWSPLATVCGEPCSPFSLGRCAWFLWTRYRQTTLGTMSAVVKLSEEIDDSAPLGLWRLPAMEVCPLAGSGTARGVTEGAACLVNSWLVMSRHSSL